MVHIFVQGELDVEINTTSKLFLMFFIMDSLIDKSVSHCILENFDINNLHCVLSNLSFYAS